MNAAYVKVPYDIKELFGKGCLPVNAAFYGVPYQGQVVKMGTTDLHYRRYQTDTQADR